MHLDTHSMLGWLPNLLFGAHMLALQAHHHYFCSNTSRSHPVITKHPNSPIHMLG